MRTVGEILKKTRLKKKISLDQVETATKINKNHLRALEENDFDQLPSFISARGFLKNYAEFLGLSSGSILAIFRRDFPDKEKKKIIHPRLLTPIGEPKFRWTPKLTLIATVVVFFLSLSFYLAHQYFSLIEAPSLEVIVPKEGQETFEEKIEIFGKADVDSLVSINGNLVLLSPEGEFRYQQDLFPGENKIVVEAKNRFGKKVKKERTVFLVD